MFKSLISYLKMYLKLFRYLRDAIVPSNMAEGSITNFGWENLELLAQVFQKAFGTIKDNFALIVVNDTPTFANALMETRIKNDIHCKSKLVVLATVAALHSIGRHKTKVCVPTCVNIPHRRLEKCKTQDKILDFYNKVSLCNLII